MPGQGHPIWCLCVCVSPLPLLLAHLCHVLSWRVLEIQGLWTSCWDCICEVWQRWCPPCIHWNSLKVVYGTNFNFSLIFFCEFDINFTVSFHLGLNYSDNFQNALIVFFTKNTVLFTELLRISFVLLSLMNMHAADSCPWPRPRCSDLARAGEGGCALKLHS